MATDTKNYAGKLGVPKLLIYPKGADYKNSQDQREYYVFYPSSVQLNTSRETQASTLTGDIPDVGVLFPEMGSRVQFIAEDGVCVFSGNLFKADCDRYGKISFTAYDMLRYLRGDYSGNVSYWEVSKVVESVLKRYAIPIGRIDSTNVKLYRHLIKAKCCLDVISEMIDFAEAQSVRSKEAMTAIANGAGDIFVLIHDPYEGVCFVRAGDVYDLVMKPHNQTSTLIGENCLATDFNLSVSIDELFNSVTVYRPGDDYAALTPAVAEDEESINKYGVLRYFEETSDPGSASREMLQRRADLILAWKNKVQRDFSVSAIGVPGIRAGMFINISFTSYEHLLGKLSRTQRAFVSECSHTWENGTHTMDLKLRVATNELPKDNA